MPRKIDIDYVVYHLGKRGFDHDDTVTNDICFYYDGSDRPLTFPDWESAAFFLDNLENWDLNKQD